MNGCVDVHQDEPNILDQTFSYNDLSRREVRSLIFHLLYAMDAFDYDVSLQGVVDNFNRGFNIAIPFVKCLRLRKA